MQAGVVSSDATHTPRGSGEPTWPKSPMGSWLPCSSRPHVRLIVGRAGQWHPLGSPAALSSPSRLGPRAVSQEPASLLTPARALLLLGTATLAPGTRPGFICIAAQMVYHSLASQNCQLPSCLFPGTGTGAGKGPGHRHSAASGHIKTPGTAGSVGLGSGETIGCKLSPLLLCPPTQNLEQMWIPHRTGGKRLPSPPLCTPHTSDSAPS